MFTVKVSVYPVDDFWLKRADNACIVQDWMLLVQVLESGCCLKKITERVKALGR